MKRNKNLSSVITKMNMEYIEQLMVERVVEKPVMPDFDVSAYTDNEYLSEISKLNLCFDKIDDFYLTLKFLKGE